MDRILQESQSTLEPLGFSVRGLEPRPPWRDYPKPRMHTPVLAERDGCVFYVTTSDNRNVVKTLVDAQDHLAHVARIAHVEGRLVLTEFIDASTLWELEPSCRPSVTDVETMLNELVTALADVPLLHGDLRPWNILYRSLDHAFFAIDWGYSFRPSEELPSKLRNHFLARGHEEPFANVDRDDSSRLVEALREPLRTAELWNIEGIRWHPPAWQ